MRKTNKIIIFVIILFSLIQIVLAVPNSINIQGKLTDSSDSVQTGTFNFTFNIYESFTGGNSLYNKTITSTTDTRGIYDIILTDVNLNFDKQLYLGVEVDNDGEMTPRGNLTAVPYSFRANTSESLDENKSYTVSGLNITGNLTLAEKITFALGEIIDNIVDGWLRITGNLNVTNNVEIGGNLNVIGNASIQGSSLTVNGTKVCLEDGTNCQAGAGYYFNKTSNTIVGSFSGGGYVGYKAGNNLCNQEFSGTHLCYESELILTIYAKNVSAMNQWDGNAWIITGGAKYSPATLPVNDCNGFTHGTSDSYLGSFWMFNQTDGGTGGVGHCANNLSIACCKTW